MADQTNNTGAGKRWGFLGYPLVIILLVVHWGLAVSSVREKSNTFDEIVFVTGGYSYWKTGDFRINAEGGVLPQYWAALPLAFSNIKFPSLDQSGWWESDPWDIGNQFFFRLGNDVETMLWRARAMIALLSVGLGSLVFFVARKLFGQRGGIIAVVLYAFSPAFLSNGALATADLCAALFFTAAVWSVWAVLQRVSVLTMLGCALALAGLSLSKMSAVLIVPMAAVMIAVRLADGRALECAIGKLQQVQGRGRQAVIFFGVAATQIVVVVFLIWAAYGFRYSAFATAQPGRDQLKEGGWEEVSRDAGAKGAVVQFARQYRLLPEAYLYGFAYTVKHAEARRTFLHGQHGVTGWWYFFPYCALMKTPLPLLVLLVLAAVAAGVKWRASAREGGQSLWVVASDDLYRAAPLLVLLAVYWTVAIRSNLNIGLRHVLPTIPSLLILAGGVAYWIRVRHRIVQIAIAVMLTLLALESFFTWPHYLAYFNQLAGGSRHGYRHLVDSSLDWGQDLPGLKRWIDRERLTAPAETPVYVSYFGTSSPNHYQLKAEFLPSHFDLSRNIAVPLRSGVYCISATMLQSVYLDTWGPWTQNYEDAYQKSRAELTRFTQSANDPAAREQLLREKNKKYWRDVAWTFDQLRFLRLCVFLRKREPDDQIGYSILIYRLSDADVERALNGPPVELHTLSSIKGIPPPHKQ